MTDMKKEANTKEKQKQSKSGKKPKVCARSCKKERCTSPIHRCPHCKQDCTIQGSGAKRWICSNVECLSSRMRTDGTIEITTASGSMHRWRDHVANPHLGQHSKTREGKEKSKKKTKTHPLESSWTFWYVQRPPKNSKGQPESWEAMLHEVGSFDSIETFWQIHHHMPKPTYLDDYYLFKTGIKPMWEDPANQHGGKWVFRFVTRDRQSLYEYWNNVVLGLIGETIDDADHISGAALSTRPRGDKVAVWTRDTKVGTNTFGNRIKEIMLDRVHATPVLQMGFDAHANWMKPAKGGKNHNDPAEKGGKGHEGRKGRDKGKAEKSK